MKKHIFSILFLVLFLTGKGFAIDNYLVVDTQKALSDSKAFTSFQTQVQANAQGLQQEFMKKEEALKKEYDELLVNKDNFSANQLETKVKDIEKRLEAIQADFNKRRQGYEQTSAETAQVIEEKAQQIVLAIAKEKSVDTVFQAYAFVLNTYPKDKDVTKEVTDRLNKELPSISVPKP